jgi:hypothetical protein
MLRTFPGPKIMIVLQRVGAVVKIRKATRSTSYSSRRNPSMTKKKLGIEAEAAKHPAMPIKMPPAGNPTPLFKYPVTQKFQR